MHINYSQTNLSTSSCDCTFDSDSIQRLLQIATQGNRESLQKHLTNNPFEDSQLNQALFCCINHCSTLSHHEQCLIILLRYKADPNCIINDRTPLMSASSMGQEIMVRRLLEYGAKVDGRDSQGNYPLFYALNKNTENFDVIELLIDRMNNLNIEIAKKITPISFAIRKEFDRTVKKLIERNITPSINEDNGDTLLHAVCKQPFKSKIKQERIIKLLMTKIGLNMKNKEGKSAIDYLHDEEIKQMILDLAKPKIKEMKTKKVKKLTQQQQIDMSGDELQEQNSPHSKINKIVEESDEEKKTEEKKQKTVLKSKRLTSTSTTTSSVKPKDLMKSITKSTSNQKFKEIKESKEVKQGKQKEKQKVTPKYQRKKSSKGTITKSSAKESTKQKEMPLKQLHVIKQLANEQAHTRSSIKQGKAKQNKEKQKQQVKQQEAKQQLLRLAAQKEKEQKQELKNRLKAQIQQLQMEMSFLDKRLKPSDHYMLGASKSCQFNSFQIASILTQQIQNFVSEQQKTCSQYVKINQQIIDLIRNLLSKKFKQIQTRIQIYGSQASGLCLQTSDIDLVLDSDLEPFQYLQLIEASQVFNIVEFRDVKFIKTTSVPIIKLQTGANLLKRKIDITFQTRYHNGVKCNALINQYMSRMSQIKPLVLVIKKLLYANQLHDTYTGGLGSYAVFLLVVAFLQSTKIDKKSDNSLGLLLLHFLKHYGYEMDYVKKSIFIYSSQYEEIAYGNNILQSNSMDLECKLILHDPLNPNNNVSRSTYKIKAIKQLFMLQYSKLLFNKRCTNECIYKQKMTVEEQYWKPCCLLQRLFIPEIRINPN